MHSDLQCSSAVMVDWINMRGKAEIYLLPLKGQLEKPQCCDPI